MSGRIMIGATEVQNSKYQPLWQDRDVRFDASFAELRLRTGEKVIEVFEKVEDTKGNSGDEGSLSITSLRLLWQSKAKPRINLTIGLGCITSITNRTLHSKLRGKHDALYLMTKVNGTRYEFIFTQMEQESNAGSSTQMVEVVSKVCKSYSATKLFRDLKLRSAIISSHGKQLKILPGEQIYNKIQGVWNLSSDQGNLGTMYVTNVRIVWHANMNELFNISLPYIQVFAIKVRESKFGVALVIESSESSGGYVLGFRIDPIERLNSVYNELVNLFNIHSSNPNYGVEMNLDYESSTVNLASSVLQSGHHPFNPAAQDLEQSEIAADSEHHHDVIAAYLTDEGTKRDQEVVYCPQLGLAIEKIKDGFSLESLWQIVPNN